MANAENEIIVQGVSTTDPVINIGGGYDILTPLLWWLGGVTGVGGDGAGVGGVFGAILGVLLFIWNIFAFLAFIFALLLLFLFIMATVKKTALKNALTETLRATERAYAGSKAAGSGVVAGRFAVLRDNVDSVNPNDWKLAIIEADIILDEAIRERGYAGTSLGERLRSIAPSQLSTLDDAWQAHKVRNQIAHAGADFVLTQKLAKETLMRYERVFGELGIL